MKAEIASINIERNGKSALVKAILPIWHKIEASGNLSISIPMLGIETNANNESDMDKFAEEAIQCFCILAEKHGRGLETELEALGWKLDISHKPKRESLLNVPPPSNKIYSEIIKTGEQSLYQVSI